MVHSGGASTGTLWLWQIMPCRTAQLPLDTAPAVAEQ